MLQFDKRGHLTPYQEQVSDTDTIFRQLVDQFSVSMSRATLFHEWTKYNRLLRGVVGENFQQWINGSFVTQKVNPGDIDLVSFIPYLAYEKREAILDKFWSDTWETEGIDAYFIKLYPVSHPNYEKRTRVELNQWVERYTATKPTQDFVMHPKGFLSIIVL